MLDVLINSAGFTEERVVDGFSGLLDLMLLAGGAGLDDSSKATVFTVRRNSGELLAIVEMYRRDDGDDCVILHRLMGVSGFAEECKLAGLDTHIVQSTYHV